MNSAPAGDWQFFGRHIGGIIRRIISQLEESLTIHLIGASAHMSPAHAQQLRDDLMQRLLKRKLNVSTVDFLELQTLTDYAVNRKDAKKG